MNKSKISPELLSDVSVLNIKNKTVFISCNNFDETKTFLTRHNYKFTTYRFANCISLTADYDDLNILSNLNSTRYIHTNKVVQTEIAENDFMNLSNLTQNKFFGQGETICFIDTGIHPHLDFIFPKCRILKFVDLINHKIFPYDDNGHGTFVTGIACGNGLFGISRQGIAPYANIVSIKALDKSGSSTSNTILDAMQWVYENHKVYNISVVCMSFGADTLNNFDPLSCGAEALWKIGISVVSAAGNSGPKNASIKSPGSNPKIITVGAFDLNEMNVAEFSSRGPTNFGSKPDLLAPGTNLISCSKIPYPYSQMSGTSVATPIVAGICAIIKSRYPKIKNNEIKKFLQDNCTKISHNENLEGSGYIDFKNLI